MKLQKITYYDEEAKIRVLALKSLKVVQESSINLFFNKILNKFKYSDTMYYMLDKFVKIFMRDGLYKNRRTTIVKAYYKFCHMLVEKIDFTKLNKNIQVHHIPDRIINFNNMLKYLIKKVSPTFFFFLKKTKLKKKIKYKLKLDIINKKTKLLLSYKLLKYLLTTFNRRLVKDKILLMFLELFLNYKNSLIFKKKSHIYDIAFSKIIE